MTQFASSKAIAVIAGGEFPGMKIILRHGNPGQGAVISPPVMGQGEKIVSPITGRVLVNRNTTIENSLYGSIDVGHLALEGEEGECEKTDGSGEKIHIRGYYKGPLDEFVWRNGDLEKVF